MHSFCGLFNNWDSDFEDVRKASISLIKKFIKIDENRNINIKSLHAKGQDHKIDVLVECILDDESYIIAIEDKTKSFEHNNQIERYTTYVNDNFPDFKKKFIFYKTYLLTEDEKSNIEDKDLPDKQKWEVYDINRIFNIFKSLDVTLKNNILIDYIEHIERLHEDLTGLLTNDISKWNDDNWVNFCVNHKPKVPEDVVFGFANYHNQYIYLVFMLNESDRSWKKTIYPYGEIRSRDIRDENKFILRILVYGIEKEILEKHLEEWKNKFEKSKYFLVQKYPKQIAISKNLENVSSVLELKLLLEKYMKIYREIMI